jgi:hypothetical protein
MKPLERAIPLPPSEALITETMTLLGVSRRRAIAVMQRETAKADLWRNDVYQVQRRVVPDDEKGLEFPMIHLNIRRIDGEPILRDWRDFQEIKNQLVGPECEAVELYPAESRKVDTSSKYHLWCFADPANGWPFGWTRRDVIEPTTSDEPGMKQRPGANGDQTMTTTTTPERLAPQSEAHWLKMETETPLIATGEIIKPHFPQTKE